MTPKEKLTISDDISLTGIIAVTNATDHSAAFLIEDAEDILTAKIQMIAGVPNKAFQFMVEGSQVTVAEAIKANDHTLPEKFRLNNAGLVSKFAEAKKEENLHRYITGGVTFCTPHHSYAAYLAITYLSEMKKFAVITTHLREFDELQSYLIEAAEKDEATGLMGRKALKHDLFDTVFDSEGFFLFIDIDDFKKLNDTYGHVSGDGVLKVFGEALDSISQKDPRWKAYRFGGDEFSVIVKIGDLEIVKEHLRSVKSYIDAHLNPEYHVFFATGAVRLYPFAKDQMSLIKCADHAMYKAKRSKKHFHLTSEETARKICL